MTCREIERRLRSAGIENAHREVSLLVAHHTGRTPDELRFSWDGELPDERGALARDVDRRVQGYPLQYLLGVWGFWRQEYEVSPDCLIPRADTEVLVETAVQRLPRGARVLELCTGSGCIAVSLVCERQDVSVVAVELYENTLAVARRNAERNGADASRLQFLTGDVLSGDFLAGSGAFDAIVSNPPYIPSAQIDALQREVSFEPRAALDGGEDGLIFYRRMLQKDYCAALREGGCWMLEIGYDQGDALRALASESGLHCEIRKDLGGLDRVAIIAPPHTLE